MKYAKFISVFFFSLFTVALFAEPSLTWHLSAFSVEDGMRTPLDVSKPANLADGTDFGITIEIDDAVKNAFCYAVYEDGEGMATVLYNGKVPSSHKVMLPSDDETFTVTPPAGMEKIHLVVCATEQKKLAQLIEKLDSAKEAKTASKKVIDEINRVKLSVSSFAETPVKPASTGGVTRGLGASTAETYSEFTGANEYVKTIRISH